MRTSCLWLSFPWIKVGDNKTWEKSLVMLLGVTIDNELKFDKYVAEICAKANRKLSVLRRLSKFLCLINGELFLNLLSKHSLTIAH